MTKKELGQVFYINKEIKMWKKELYELEMKSKVGAQQYKNCGGSQKSDPTASAGLKKAALEEKIQTLLLELQIQREAITEYILTIDDSLIRQIMYLRHISCMSWRQIAMEIGGGNTEGSIKMIYHRFFEKK